ncbi:MULTISPECIES: DUF4225 domain-containing protein [Proteus]|uniref:DUF4225 domain-containing protein n=1 Tax=Proteus TaxID=583 RepID=UPI000D68A31E|nr:MULTISPECIES: DUF4225 domain-containing protein [Proteus]MBG5949282.1 DUF4225 domain-containing protein [Proteus terrae]MCE9840086.1 DUF4225 domain-containing protein [Proteus terrae]MCT8264299.1 DUF4225 domain-containing protein [Proteus terrae]NBN71154.1 DUF4225 domain-containing protein [Proteus sp. G2618]
MKSFYFYNGSNYKGFVRKEHEGIFELLRYKKILRSLVYGELLSGYKLYMGVLRKDVWKLFYYINTDNVYNHQQASGFPLFFINTKDLYLNIGVKEKQRIAIVMRNAIIKLA